MVAQEGMEVQEEAAHFLLEIGLIMNTGGLNKHTILPTLFLL